MGLAEKRGWPCIRAPAKIGLLNQLRAQRPVDVVVLCAGEDDAPLLDLCRGIKFDPTLAYLSVVWLLASPTDQEREQAFAAGADDCIPRSASDGELAVRLGRAVERKQATESLEDATAIVVALANAVEGKDHYTCGHVERVSAYSVEIGQRLNLPAADIDALKIGGMVHDIGKVGIPDHILNKQGKLTDDETRIMRRHPAIGYDILKPLRTFQAVPPIVRWHHERPDGQGYPDGIEDSQLPLLPRIVTVADCFDALTTDRPYRRAYSPDQALRILAQMADDGELDASVIAVLQAILGQGLAADPAVPPVPAPNQHSVRSPAA